jgi:septal ring factor EnvC (AmiA/AmiB activator)
LRQLGSIVAIDELISLYSKSNDFCNFRMSSPPDPHRDRPESEEFDELDRALAEVEQALDRFKQRYSDVRRDREQIEQLKQRREDVRREAKQTPKGDRSHRRELKEELEHIEAAIETLEIHLESQLFSWKTLKEPFWQAVRFGGLGIVVGWILKSCSG